MKRIVSVSSVLVLTFGHIAGVPQQVAAQVATHTITVTQDANGTIAPDTTVVNVGFSQFFTITPAAGFYIADVTVDGSSAGSHAAYAFANVTADHTITASFALIPLGADTIPGTVMDVSGPTTFTLDPGTPGPFVWFVVMNSDITTINGIKTIIPGPTTLVIDRLGQLMSAGSTIGITSFRDQVVVSGRAEPDNGGLFPLSIIDNSVPAIPSDVTATVTMVKSGYRYNRTTHRFVQKVTVRNAGSGDIAGPVSLVLDNLSANAALFGPSAFTSVILPLGSPYLNLDLRASGNLATGQTATVTLQFSNPTMQGITYTTRVLAGPGGR